MGTLLTDELKIYNVGPGYKIILQDPQYPDSETYMIPSIDESSPDAAIVAALIGSRKIGDQVVVRNTTFTIVDIIPPSEA